MYIQLIRKTSIFQHWGILKGCLKLFTASCLAYTEAQMFGDKPSKLYSELWLDMTPTGVLL